MELLTDRYLDQLELALGLADTQEKLERLLHNHLPDLLRGIASYSGAPARPLGLLQHIHRRVKSTPSLQLPLDELLQQYLDPQITIRVKAFTILYLDLALQRSRPSEQVLGKLLWAYSAASGTQQTLPHREAILSGILRVMLLLCDYHRLK